ncbi:MAG: hypothetical protein NVV68_08395 [Dokdonella sp.]|jgi:hypothetical protein|nr:hypothetical protein [Dokdonella sp.]
MALWCFIASPAFGFQIAASVSSIESRLTNEPDSTLRRTGLKLGVLLKSPVHEEITQLAYGCPVSPAKLAKDEFCGRKDGSFADAFVIYGVRWNDVPPFRLLPEEGNCSYLGKRCRTDQTIRFATQPDCWLCLFKDAEKKTVHTPIRGCLAQSSHGAARGNLMTRSHFGDLQFLHSMAYTAGQPAIETRDDVIDWIEFAWKVASREITPQQKLKDIDNPTLKTHFGCSEWTVADLYILGRQDAGSGLISRLHQIAFGSILHTVQDSFAAGHTTREPRRPEGTCASTSFRSVPRIVEFHSYAEQDGALHDHEDSREALVGGVIGEDWPLAVETTRHLFDLHDARTNWDEVRPYVECLFMVTPDAAASSGGKAFARGRAVQ